MAVSAHGVEVREVPGKKWYAVLWLGKKVIAGWGQKSQGVAGTWKPITTPHAFKKRSEQRKKGYINSSLGNLPDDALDRVFDTFASELGIPRSQVRFDAQGDLIPAARTPTSAADSAADSASSVAPAPPPRARRSGQGRRRRANIHIWI